MKRTLNRNILQKWLNESDGLGGGLGGPPTSPPGGPGDPMGTNPVPPPPQGGPNLSGGDQNPESLGEDPQYPDMQDEPSEDQDFENWKIAFVKESIKGNPNDLTQLILKIRDKELDPYPNKFVEDNLDICYMRQHQDFLLPSKKIRDLIKKQLDRNAPATTIVNHTTQVLGEHPLITNMYIKLLGMGGGKGDNHRKLVATLLGAVQVGSGSDNEDLVFEEDQYSIRISTRFNSEWGNVQLGSWTLKENDPEKFLKTPELSRLDGGSPEEKDVLRRRVVMDSIASMFAERAFIINCVSPDGTIYHLGLDLGNCLRSAFIDGKLVVRTRNSDISQAFIDEDGSIVPVPDMSIYFVKQSQDYNEKGKPELEEFEFIAHRNGMLFLKATVDLIKEASTTLQGIVFKETPWQGNPSDLKKQKRCVVRVFEQFIKDC